MDRPLRLVEVNQRLFEQLLCSAVSPPAVFIRLVAHGALFTVADGPDAHVRTQLLQVLHRGPSTTLAESHVVLVGSTLIRVPFDNHVLATLRNAFCIGLQCRTCILRRLDFVEVVVDCFQVAQR